jgi:hypothetical protein
VLSEDQVRLLYAAKIAHGLGVVPTDLRVNVHRRRKGAALAVGDFTAQPLRLYNFTAGALTDAGSTTRRRGRDRRQRRPVAGADGTLGNGYSFGAHNAACPRPTPGCRPLTARSYGCWFKTTAQNSYGVLCWGGGRAPLTTRCLPTCGAIASGSGGDP